MAVEKRTKAKNMFFVSLEEQGVSTPDWARVYKATEFEIEFNPETETYDYISDTNPSTEIMSYEPSISFDMLADLNDPLYILLDDMAYGNAIGSDANVDYLLVKQRKDTNGDFLAQSGMGVIEFDTDNYVEGVLNWTIRFKGTPKMGTATVSALGVPSFTENTTP